MEMIQMGMYISESGSSKDSIFIWMELFVNAKAHKFSIRFKNNQRNEKKKQKGSDILVKINIRKLERGNSIELEEAVTWTSTRPVLWEMTTSMEPSGLGLQNPLSACIGSPEFNFQVFWV